MTTVSFFSSEDRLTGFRCEGHSGYAEEGADIVCSAVTTLVRMAETTLSDVLGLGLKTRVDPEKASVLLKLPATMEESDDEIAQAVLAGLMLTLAELRDEYPDNLQVLEAE